MSFEDRLESALCDEHRGRALLSFQRDWRTARGTATDELASDVGPYDAVTAALADAKRRTRARWPEVVEEFRRAATTNGSIVHGPLDADAACDTIAEVCAAAGAGLVVKGKSMATEEIALNQRLEDIGLDVLETDLGEWILQLAVEAPTHLVLPMIHKRRHDVATVLESELGRAFDPDDIDRMVEAVRDELGPRFFEASVGITGANALVASTGAVMTVCNEGNNRMAASVPGVHIVVAGIDKLFAESSDLVHQIRLLGRNATGQRITTYTNFCSGPRNGQVQHIVLLDNGRTDIVDDPVFDAAAGCIRCGACADVCPPYQVVGGDVFGHIYTGAIGLVTTKFHHGLEAIAQAQELCVSCGACTVICPAEIPLAEQILEVRREVHETLGPRRRSRLALAPLASRRRLAAASTLGAVLSSPFRSSAVRDAAVITRGSIPRHGDHIPIRSARSRLRSMRDAHYDADTVMLFLQCVTDRVLPAVAVATAALLQHAGWSVSVPSRQHCCGLPFYDAGDWDTARRLAAQTLDVLRGGGPVVTPAPSCAIAIAETYQKLLPDRAAEVRALRERVSTVTEFLCQAGLPDLRGESLAVHEFCHATNECGSGKAPTRLIDRLGGSVVELPEADVCCGFGGVTAAAAPEVSARIGRRKLDCFDVSGAEVLVVDNPGCLIHLRSLGPASLRIEHTAQVIARGLDERTRM